MKITRCLTAGLVAALSAQARQNREHSTLFPFQPETADSIWNGDIPILFSSESQSTEVGASSWWTSSFITGTNNEQFLVLSNYLDNPLSTVFRSSILNLRTLSYNYFNSYGNSTNHSPILDVKVGDSGIQSLTADDVSRMRAYSNHENATFDTTYDATSHALPNAGGGAYKFGSGVSYEWGLPNCRTQGSITERGGQKTTIDPARSFTWYDRQWGSADILRSNWTWFELHIPQTSYELSAWVIDDTRTNQFHRFVTIRGANDEIQVLPFKWKPNYERTYQSIANPDVRYAPDWELDISGFGVLQVSSIISDQEIVGTTGLQTAYEGFVTFRGSVRSKKVEGYGLVEVFYPTWDIL